MRGFGGEGHLGRRSDVHLFTTNLSELTFIPYESSYAVLTSCPACGEPVYFYKSPYNGRVFFDSLGHPWPKHPCTDNRLKNRYEFERVIENEVYTIFTLEEVIVKEGKTLIKGYFKKPKKIFIKINEPVKTDEDSLVYLDSNVNLICIFRPNAEIQYQIYDVTEIERKSYKKQTRLEAHQRPLQNIVLRS